MDINLKQKLLDLELYLTKPDIRSSELELGRFLSNNFLEIASTGLMFGKAEALTRIPNETSPVFTSNNFEFRELGTNVVQIIYRATIRMPNETKVRYSLRSSIWKKNDSGWQMEFHQGTPCEPF